ncbi:MAG: cytochrome c peroxidase [Planctomycetota bacterium]
MKNLIRSLLFASLCLLGHVVDAAEPAADRSRRLRLPETPFKYGDARLSKSLRERVAALDNTPSENPITDHGATLGRVLFYDTTLSLNGTTSCASCHQQQFAFTDGVKVSTGFDGQKVDRNSMSLVNLRYYRRGKFFWDERAASLEEQVLMPIENPVEMGHDLKKLTRQLAADPIYPPLFNAAFGDTRVTRERIGRALAQFLRSITSFRSRYDIGLAQVASPREDFPNFTAQENLGKQQFFGRALCADCHLPNHSRDQWTIFQLERPGNNGIDSNLPGDDFGVAEASGQETDRGLFKPSTLRNLDVTGPYMHDGRFHTVDQVIEHYNWSVRPHENLDARLQDFMANGMALPEVEKVALAKFLSTLTDQELLTDERYSDPFE